ncbi:hypothetical protein [Mesorhizobium huakuii]|uniref:Uncharacterized protein n=1 Tax=Mesorhizobium huakuii TaxID=28104 RepID=A0A7G6SL46_9HYPH|nr:hypothetical protein [Mesorhizobium huakuii]QND55228.1 hypothetical protein HB778_04410 [Mesorhizobium huakuii]
MRDQPADIVEAGHADADVQMAAEAKADSATFTLCASRMSVKSFAMEICDE